MREFFRVTLEALMFTVPLMSRASMTVPGVETVMEPEGVRATPAGTPVLAAVG